LRYSFRHFKNRTAIALLVLASVCRAQSNGPHGEVRTSADFRSAVPNGEATPEILSLTFLDAIDRALKYNLAMVSGDLDIRQTRAQRMQTLADLLPNLSVRPSVTEEQTSLASFGFTNFPGVPPILGPFTVVDARAVMSAPVVDLKAWRKYKAGAEDIKAAQLNYQDARDEVVLVSTGLYLQALAGSARIESSRAQVAVSEALYHQAADRKDAGTAPAIDVLRAEVEWKQQQQRLISNEGGFEKQKLALSRAIGLPLGQKFSLADPMPYDPVPAGYTLDNLLDLAFRQRPDYLAKQSEVHAAELRKQSAAAGRLPTVSLDANYGVVGPRIDQVHGTFGVAGSVNIPVYQGGRVRADVADAEADLQHRKSELAAIRARIDAEVRAALLDVLTANRLVDVARGNVDLARRQLEQSRDRFADGVTNNVEVVQAQQALTAAEESYISSLYSFNAAKTQVAKARGDAGKSVIEYLKGKR
jgi:outer membrane protein TolC